MFGYHHKNEIKNPVVNRATKVEKDIPKLYHDPNSVILFIRPPGFGKTHCLSQYSRYLSERPVIELSFKSINANTFEKSLEKFKLLIETQYAQNCLIFYEDYRGINGLSSSILTLASRLFEQYQTKITLLIDDYDVPLQAAYVYRYYPKMKSFMHDFFNFTLKDTTYLHQSILFGSFPFPIQFDNWKQVHPKLSFSEKSCYDTLMGFTYSDVRLLFKKTYGMECHDDLLLKLEQWYGGYLFGDTSLFHPKYIIQWIKDNPRIESLCFKSYAAMDAYHIKNLLIKACRQRQEIFLEDFKKLVKKECILKKIEYLRFDHFVKDTEVIWSFLVYNGFLRKEKWDTPGMYKLSAPNKTVQYFFHELVDLISQHHLTKRPEKKENQDKKVSSILQSSGAVIASPSVSIRRK